MITSSINPPTDTPTMTGIEVDEADSVDKGAEVKVGWIVGALVGGNTTTNAEVAPSEVTFTLAVTLAPRATDATFSVRVKLPDDNAADS